MQKSRQKSILIDVLKEKESHRDADGDSQITYVNYSSLTVTNMSVKFLPYRKF